MGHTGQKLLLDVVPTTCTESYVRLIHPYMRMILLLYSSVNFTFHYFHYFGFWVLILRNLINALLAYKRVLFQWNEILPWQFNLNPNANFLSLIFQTECNTNHSNNTIVQISSNNNVVRNNQQRPKQPLNQQQQCRQRHSETISASTTRRQTINRYDILNKFR